MGSSWRAGEPADCRTNPDRLAGHDIQDRQNVFSCSWRGIVNLSKSNGNWSLRMVSVVETSSPQLSLVHGAAESPLYRGPIGALLKEQVSLNGSKTALVSSWQKQRLTYTELSNRSADVARALLDLGLRRNAHVGIFAGNCHEYIEVFLGGGRIGRPIVALNSTYTPAELCKAVAGSGEHRSSIPHATFVHG